MAQFKLKPIKANKVKNLMKLDSRDMKKNKPVDKVIKKKEINRKVVSIDIGSEKTKIVIGKYFGGKLEVEKLIMANTPQNSIVDGNITNYPSIVNFIEQKLTNEKIKIKDAIFTSNSTAIINREILIPVVEEDEIETVVKFEIQQYLPLNMSDYVVQQNVLGVVDQGEQKRLKTLVLTYPEKMARNYYKLTSDINLRPVALDITYNSLKKLINFSKEINNEEYNKEASIVFIDMGAKSLSVQIYKNGNVDFTRMIKSGGSNIDSMLSKVLQSTDEEAEKEKIDKGSVSMNPENIIDDIVRIVVEEWVSELQRIIQFYKNMKMGNNVEKIFLYGGSSNIRGIEGYISERLNLPVEKLKELKNLNINKKANENIEQYLNAIGAIIRL
ncbi:MAG: type IV pilus assembly protein PilM [Clostridiaceae bacterium]